MNIRAIRIDTDFDQIRSCVVELQDYERQFDPRMPTGESIADAYIEEMQRKCNEHDGQIFLSEIDGSIAGYVTVLARVSSGDLDDGDLVYSYIDDLIVSEKFRKLGVGKKLVEAAELFAKSKNARWLRLSVLARNTSARNLYSSAGFSELYVDYEKSLIDSA
jgi:ribosomal protein S18 acetylase RimI-like enzyme